MKFRFVNILLFLVLMFIFFDIKASSTRVIPSFPKTAFKGFPLGIFSSRRGFHFTIGDRVFGLLEGYDPSTSLLSLGAVGDGDLMCFKLPFVLEYIYYGFVFLILGIIVLCYIRIRNNSESNI